MRKTNILGKFDVNEKQQEKKIEKTAPRQLQQYIENNKIFFGFNQHICVYKNTKKYVERLYIYIYIYIYNTQYTN